ncbi:hypothetical protein [Herbaspirillum sp. NPDC087042]|uniref:hypothetical protein n=1 Tax=Herbaspirillum sp. NPDC087042 TaxID=3364004 RepID=UPI003819FDEA
MKTLKEELYSVCNDVAAVFPGWRFESGKFKNKSLKHTDLIVHLGFGFEKDTTPVCPSINISNKRLSKLSKQILGADGYASSVSMQVIARTLSHTPEKLRTGFWIEKNKDSSYLRDGGDQSVESVTVDILNASTVLMAVMKDAISFIEGHYDLSSEANMLSGLPVKYTTRHVNSPYDQQEKMKGVMLCLVHLLYGDFDFVENYRSEAFGTIFPKRTVELDKIIAVLPVLKKHFSETGSVI